MLVCTPITRHETLNACHSGWSSPQSTNLSSHRRRAKWSSRAWRRTLGIYGSFQTRRMRARGASNPQSFASAVGAPPWRYTWGMRLGGAPPALGWLSPGPHCSGARSPGGSTPEIVGKTRHMLSSNPRSRLCPRQTHHPPSTTFGFVALKQLVQILCLWTLIKEEEEEIKRLAPTLDWCIGKCMVFILNISKFWYQWIWLWVSQRERIFVYMYIIWVSITILNHSYHS